MSDPKSFFKRTSAQVFNRWQGEDYPGGEKRFQPKLFGRDLFIFVGLPTLAVIGFDACQHGCAGPIRHDHKDQQKASTLRLDASKSQIITFQGSGPAGASYSGVPRRSPGTLVKLRLLNTVETFSTAPVYAQIIDLGLGKSLIGGTLIGDANPDANFERINMTFRFAREPNRSDLAAPIAAQALSLDGTLGVEAEKKDGFFTRSVFSGAAGATQGVKTPTGNEDLRDLLFHALSAGFLQEFGATAKVEQNRSQVLTLHPNTEFFAELTDFFPARGSQ